MSGYVDQLELILARDELDGKVTDSSEVIKYLTVGWAEPWMSCMYCGSATRKHDKIMRRRIAKTLGKPVGMIVKIWACERCIEDLGYGKGESITSRREYLIRKYTTALYEKKTSDKKVKAEIDKARAAAEKVGHKRKKKGQLKRGTKRVERYGS